MSTDIIERPKDELIHNLLVAGDTSRLSAAQKTEFYMQTCSSLGLNPVTRPFDFIKLNGKEVLYAKKDATEQLRKINGVSVETMEGKTVSDIYIVTVKVKDAHGRTDIATGAVSVAGLKGDGMANATMKAETKAKRRATLSICGLGIFDESEIETIPNAAPVPAIEAPQEQRTAKPKGNVEAALKAIHATVHLNSIESIRKKLLLSEWAEEDALKIDDALTVAVQRIKEGVTE